MDKTINITIDQIDLLNQKIAEADSKLKEIRNLLNEISEIKLKLIISKPD